LTTATALGGTLEPVVGAGARSGNVGVIAGETRNLVDAQTLLGCFAQGLGADERTVAAVATNLAAFIALRDTANALVGNTRRDAAF